MSEEIEAGTFDYLKWFPNGNKADHFRPTVSKQLETKPLTIKQFYETWIEKKRNRRLYGRALSGITYRHSIKTSFRSWEIWN